MSTPTPAASGTATPIVELNAEEAALSLKVSLADLSAHAAAQYAQKNYDEAAELYAQAAEMQAEMNGEMNPDNAEILFLYGRALFKVGQSKSDVLGGRAPEPKPEKKAAKSKKQKKAATEEKEEGSSSLIKDAVEQATKGAQASIAEAAKEVAHKDEPNPEKKPLFHFEGDENFDDSDKEEEDDDEDAEEGEEEDEEDDDLAVAFQVLDLARVLFEKKLATLEAEQKTQEEGKGKEKESDEAATTTEASPLIKHIKERLGDLHDLLAEISLENERYPAAITDSRASLKYKQQLYTQDSEIIAEAHFKLSLALEFASVTKSSDDDSAVPSEKAGAGGAGVVDQALRDEAAAELEAAIASTKLKLQNKEVELASTHNPEDNDATRRQIADVKEVISDMEQRLVDLRKPPIDINEALGIAAPVSGTKGESSLKVAEEVKEKANDLTGLVKKKRKAESEAAPAEEGAPEAKKVKEE
ncbi:hypothetical protein NEUTE1DRAFT_115688 [Neurospora tetrasperma FGSC 2508]|uniref:Tetratricopeptide SHNi-TPR domain-containing protein n=1 Tax=Neurospora tetrasperma (strain FGSC 2508 / ATCC MYA-4615 / P0657) TaxID=510951 RepID=F8MBR0_NEUT8|nr:uncharacterized protein NEUTE1DRAFT_115688 [Neurospora tetrasperma FGSC 2508]EGO60318.1 hypothetical protein NEUTE1DRAFT_115688 [Neurospora tetrasperma FGSC 2508]EGZ75711.1 hypothetical protein NEUTE2DRAFT_143792 [Neurospora tetrasperma FGSC 2509]